MSDYLVTVNRRWVDLEPEHAVRLWSEFSIFPIRKELASGLRMGDLLVIAWGLPRRLASVVVVNTIVRAVDVPDLGLTFPRYYSGVQGSEFRIPTETPLFDVVDGIPASQLAFGSLPEDAVFGLLDWLSIQEWAQGVAPRLRDIRNTRFRRFVRDLVTSEILGDEVLRQSWLTWRLMKIDAEEDAATPETRAVVPAQSLEIRETNESYPFDDPRAASMQDLEDFYESVVLAPFDFLAGIQKHMRSVAREFAGLRLGDEDGRGQPPLDIEELLRRSEEFRPMVDILRSGLRKNLDELD